MLFEKLFGRILYDAIDNEGASGTDTSDTSDTADVTDYEDTSDDSTPSKADWPDDWRSKISADEKHSKTLSRFASPKALYESYTALRHKLDSGEIKQQIPFPAQGSDEAKAAWRKSNGVPEKVEEYKAHFKNKLADDAPNKDVIEDFLAHAHQHNMRPEQAESILGWYQSVQARQNESLQSADSKLLEETEDSLRAEWGGEYKRNINLIKGLVSSMPKDVQPLFIGARLADGRALVNAPEMTRWLLETALTVNPVGVFVPGTGANIASAIEDEIGSIEKVMKTDRKRYNSDEKMQARLRDLYTAQARAKK